MGTNINIMTEIKNYEGKWVCADPYTRLEDTGDIELLNPVFDPTELFYALCAVLANVRNNFGITPISEPRGVPTDASVLYLEWVESYDGVGQSHSYHTLRQLLDHTPRGPLAVIIDELHKRFGTKIDPDQIRIVFFFD